MSNGGLRVLFTPDFDTPKRNHPWITDATALVEGRNELRIATLESIEADLAWAEVVADFHDGARDPRVIAHLDKATNLRFWQVVSVGIDQFKFDWFRKHGIPVANVAGSTSAIALAECAFMLLLMVARQYPDAQTTLRAGELGWPVVDELDGMRVGVLGLGASGREFALRARAFGMKVYAIDVRQITAAEVLELGLEWAGTPTEMDGILPILDALSLHLSLTPESRHILNRDRLLALRKGAYVVNVARGRLIDQPALADALRSGHLGGAGLDVFETEPPPLTDPILSLPNVVTLPHTAGVTKGTSRRRAAFVAANIDRIAQGLEPLSRVA